MMQGRRRPWRSMRTLRPYKVGDRVALNRAHHSHAAALRQRVGHVGEIVAEQHYDRGVDWLVRFDDQVSFWIREKCLRPAA